MRKTLKERKDDRMIQTLAAQIKEYKKVSILTPICMVLEVLMETIIPLLMASIIDDGVNKGDMNHIVGVGLWMVLTAALSLTAGVLGGVFGAKASTGFARNLRKGMFENIQTFSFANIDKYSVAGLVTRLTTDVTNLQNAYQMVLRMSFRAPATLICAMAMAFVINARLAMIYLVAVVVLGSILIFIMSKASRHFRAVFRKYDDLNASVQENVSAIRDVKSFVREDYENNKFTKAAENLCQMVVKAERIVVTNMPLMQFTVYTCILLISWIGAKMIVSDALTTGQLMSLLTYCMNILMSLMMLSMIFVMVTMSAASGERVAEVLKEKSSLTNPENPDFVVTDGSIEFRGVEFSYSSTAERPVLEDINLAIRSGETIGIIGGTGSSKSSLVNLISRLYDVTKGSILVGGKDVRAYDRAEGRFLWSAALSAEDSIWADCGFAGLSEDEETAYFYQTNVGGVPLKLLTVRLSDGEIARTELPVSTTFAASKAETEAGTTVSLAGGKLWYLTEIDSGGSVQHCVQVCRDPLDGSVTKRRVPDSRNRYIGGPRFNQAGTKALYLTSVDGEIRGSFYDAAEDAFTPLQTMT